jgi:hypothetical protein
MGRLTADYLYVELTLNKSALTKQGHFYLKGVFGMISFNQVISSQVPHNHISVQMAALYSDYSMQYLQRFPLSFSPTC